MKETTFGSLAIALAALFAGAAIYITLAEQPARLLLDDRSLLLEWRTTYTIGIRMQGTLVILAGLAGIAAWWISRDWRWMLGTALIIANWPYTLIMLQPVNAELMSMALEQAGGRARALIERWGSLHMARGALGILALSVFLWALKAHGTRRITG